MDQVSYKSGYTYLLREVNWEVKRGEHWVVFGLNGSGKTTLLSILAGYRPNTHGKLEVLGQEYSDETIFSIRKKIGWVSSSFFDKYMNKESVMNIILSGLSGTLGIRRGIPVNRIMKAKQLLQALGLSEKADYPFQFLSKGERESVLIIRALLSEPEILILDEPTTGLDLFARERLLNTVEQLAQQKNMTILYVTHYPEEILPEFGKCMLLRRGRVYAKGATEEVFTAQKLSSFFNYPVTVSKTEKQRYQVDMNFSSNLCDLL